jgi:hypothetical protein
MMGRPSLAAARDALALCSISRVGTGVEEKKDHERNA